jgi:diacylglycerol kinase (ATP)
MKSFIYAWQGLAEIIRKQHNFWIHLSVAGIVIVFGLVVGIAVQEWLAIILVIGFVLSAETMNTALEYFVDLVSPKYHELAGKVKDIAAGAVLIAAITAVIIGLIVFIPKVF